MPAPDSTPSANQAAINPPVFFGAAALILVVVIIGAVAPEATGEIFSAVQDWIVDTLGWFYVLVVAVFLVFVLGLAISGHGRVKLGPDDSEPDFSYLSWFAMLFSAGMGIGLMFFGVAEPVMHFGNPPVGEGGTVDAAKEAMEISFFHWGIHAWAIYAVVGLSLAYFGFRHNLPLTVRSALYPLIGERIRGPIGHAVDIFAVLGTMFGVATSLGLGVMQVNAGLNHLFDIPQGLTAQLILIAAITLMATASVVSGLDAGIRRISELNLFLAVALLVFVLVAGPTVYLLQTLIQNVGAYLSDIVDKTFTLYAYEPNDWIGGWTLFYWGWWIAWSPFVGMFIARVSRGRTIREFIVGVLFVPVGFTVMWLTFFGNTAIGLELEGVSAISAAVAENVPLALFTFFEQMPLSFVASLVATVLVVTFFVTSSDSGSLVIDIITSGGDKEPPVWQRVFWALTEGVVAAVLLLAGGLKALQTASIASALPFAAIMLVICYGTLKGLRMEAVKRMSATVPASVAAAHAGVPWQKRLKAIISHPTRDKVTAFLHDTAKPALEAVAAEVRETDWRAEVSEEQDRVTLTVYHDSEREFVYGIALKAYRMPTFAFPEFPSKVQDMNKHRYYRAEVFLMEGGQHYDVMGFTKEQVIADVLDQYDKHMHFLHFVRADAAEA